MADITMCKGTYCPKAVDCYRCLAVPSYYQSYFTEVPYKDGNCEYFWQISERVW